MWTPQACPFPVAEHPIAVPTRTLCLNKFPTDGPLDDPTDWSPHIDSFVREDPDTGTRMSGWRTEPRPLVLQMILYLTGTGAPGEGGTTVWPGSHARINKLYLSDPERFASLEAIAPLVPELCEDITPHAVAAEAGEILFYDLFCGHGSSTNSTSDHVRLATNHKFAVPFQQQPHLFVGVNNRD